MGLLTILELVPKAAWGFSESTHCQMVAEALELIKALDAQKGEYVWLYENQGNPYYTPLPNSSKPGPDDHPLVVGAWSEDAAKDPRTDRHLQPAAQSVLTFRDYRHFGGDNLGLSWESYFLLRKGTVQPNGPRYISAHDWGEVDGAAHQQLGVGGDKMNFGGAIDAYNFYTPEGRKEALVRLGHLLHLLQDQAQPDHALLVPHPGSSYNDFAAADLFKKCLALYEHAVEIGTAACAVGCAPAAGWFGIGYLACFGPCEVVAFGVANATLAACMNARDRDELGFEALVRDKWTFDQHHFRNQALVSTILREASYDAYFKKTVAESTQAAKQRNLQSPLGLGSMLVGPIAAAVAGVTSWSSIPGLDPDIQFPDDARPYLELADAVIPRATGRCAGLLINFFDIVNYPPIVPRVEIVQGADGLTSASILDGSAQTNAVYEAGWKETKPDPSADFLDGRELEVDQDNPISADQRLYLLAEVTDEIPQMTLRLNHDTAGLLGTPAMTRVTHQGRTWFAADLLPTSFSASLTSVCEEVEIELSAEDTEPHFGKPDPAAPANQPPARNHPGNVLDSDPATLARASSTPPYDWLFYEPGSDKNHRFRVVFPDRNESVPANDSQQHASAISYPPTASPVLGAQFTDYTVDDASDIDFYDLDFPSRTQQEIDCRTASLPPDVTRLDGQLTVFATAVDPKGSPDPSHGAPVLTFHRSTGAPFTPSQIQVRSPAPEQVVATIPESDLDTLFPGGKATFSVTAGAGKRICYDLWVRQHWCVLLKDTPRFLQEIDEIFILGRLPLPRDRLPVSLWSFPAAAANVQRVLEGELPRPEFFLVDLEEPSEIEVEIGVRAAGELEIELLDGAGRPLARAAAAAGVAADAQVVHKSIRLDSLDAGQYLLRVSSAHSAATYELNFSAAPLHLPRGRTLHPRGKRRVRTDDVLPVC